MASVNYYLNGVDIREYGFHVSAGKGLLSVPEAKAPNTHSYDNEHGMTVDVSRMYLKERTITLNCFSDKLGMSDFLTKITTLTATMAEAGMMELQVDVGANKRLVYEVYYKGKSDVEIKYIGGKAVCTMSLALVEPEPVKRVYKVKVSTAGKTLTLAMPSGNSRFYTVYWGDGSRTDNATGGDSLSHTYTAAGDRLLVICGDIAALSGETITGETGITADLIWTRL